MGIGNRWNESNKHGRLVLIRVGILHQDMSQASVWRTAWRLLRDKCGLSHYQTRAIFSEHLGGLSFHRNLVHTELKADESHYEEQAVVWALMLNNRDHEIFISRLKDIVWEEGEPILELTLVRLIDKQVREWNDWGEDVRQQIKDKVLRKLSKYESRTGLEAWTERHLQTYLAINGCDTQV